jgi:DNA/RNA endonuclease G (NUC1)
VGAGFNRDYWARFEKFVRDLTRSSEVVYVVTGPLFIPRRRQPTDPSASPNTGAKFVMSYELLGEPPALVAVPTAFYKVYAQVYMPMPPAPVA